MNYFTKSGESIFKKIDIATQEVDLLNEIKFEYYNFFHYGYELDFSDLDDEELQAKREELQETWKQLRFFKFSDGKSCEEIVALDEMSFDNYCNSKAEVLEKHLDTIRDYIDEETARAIDFLYVSKRAGNMKINNVDIDKFDYSFLIGAEIIDELLTSVADFLKEEKIFFKNEPLKQEQILTLQEIFFEYGLDDIFSDFKDVLQNIIKRWQNDSITDISFATIENFYKNNGETISKELKTMLDNILLFNDKEYQKFIKEFQVKGVKIDEL